MFNICSYMSDVIYVQFFKANELIPLIVDDMHKSTINYTRINTPTSTEKAFTLLNNVKSVDEDDVDEVLM